MPDSQQIGNGALWFLEGFTEESGPVRRIPILSYPFEVGRRPGLSLTLSSSLISQRHAVISGGEAGLEVRDFGSTNGTFLNGDRVDHSRPLREGDILHFGRLEFRLGKVDAEEAEALLAGTIAVSDELPRLMIDRSRILREMMRRRDVVSVFQPIVTLQDLDVVGFEVLGRGLLQGSHTASGELFTTAQVLGAEAELSRLFRAQCVLDCRSFPGDPIFFINTHPAEVGSPDLVESLRDFRRQAPDLKTVLEIHESTVTNPGMIRRLHEILQELEIGLAYDDFGAGQARLQELAEIQPDYLKFDISLIRDIDSASESRHRVLASMVELSVGLGIAPIAEGVESEAEAKICAQIGFRFGQGYLFGAPKVAEDVVGISSHPRG
ncbi:MAG: EAL domain-containing protein [Acidobacteriota bacterium]|nr:EAL domain-containing protein [Acidobacteriota bacterium]